MMAPFENYSIAIPANVKLSICVPALDIGASSAFYLPLETWFRGHWLG